MSERTPVALWDSQAVADHLGVPVWSVRKWRSQGTGPIGVKLGRHVRYRPADVEAWVEQQKTAERSQAAG